MITRSLMLLTTLAALSTASAFAGEKEVTDNFRNSGQSASFFENAYGYAVFPSIGKGGAGIGGARGKGKVYVNGEHVGDTTMTQLTVGLQLGGQFYSEIIFFRDRKAFEEFTGGNFEFGAGASAVAITAGATASAGTGGTEAGVSGTQKHKASVGRYNESGMAVFTVAKGGLMYEAAIGGQKFSFKEKR